MSRPARKRRRPWVPAWIRFASWRPARQPRMRVAIWKRLLERLPDLRAVASRLATRPKLPSLRVDLRAMPERVRTGAVAFGRSPWGRRFAVGTGVALASGVLVAGWIYGPPLAAAIADHPYFTVSEIVVTPTQHVRAGALLESVDLKAGVSLWRVDPAALAARFESQPWIRRAGVRREFPRRLIVDLVEREPAAILYLDQLYYVDSTGIAFAQVGERDPLDLPFVTGVEAAIVADERPFARHAIRQALRLLHSMQAAGLPFRVSEVHIERERGITVYPIEPRVALTFGWSGFGTKLTRLQRVLQDFRGRESQIREIDLTMGATAVVRVRQPAAKGTRTRT